MQFMPMRALSRDTQSVLECLQRDGELIVTSNGQPTILLVDLAGRDVIETVSAFRRAKLALPAPNQQRDALRRFFSSVDAIEDEPITDEDFAAFNNRTVSFKKDLDL